MYHKIGIQKLSHAQIGKLLRGERIRVKHGSHHNIHASAEQHKKIMTAHRKGAGSTIQFDPYQIDMHKHMKHGHSGGGEGGATHAHVPVHRSHHRGHGDGWLEDTGRILAPVAIDIGKKLIEKRLGLGKARARRAGRGEGEGLHKRKVGRPKKHAVHHAHHGHAVHHAHRGHGDGWIDDLKNIGSTLGQPFQETIGVNPFNMGYDLGEQVLAPAILGKGIHHRKVGHPRKHTGGALMPAGTGNKRGRPRGKGKNPRGRRGKGEDSEEEMYC